MLLFIVRFPIQVLFHYPSGLLPTLLRTLFIGSMWVTAFIGGVFLARILLVLLTGYPSILLFNSHDILEPWRRLFMFGKKKNSSTEEVCSVCGTTARLTKPSKLDPTTPPGILQINQHSNILAEIPFQL